MEKIEWSHDDYWKAKETVRRLEDCYLRGLLLSDTEYYYHDLCNRVQEFEERYPLKH